MSTIFFKLKEGNKVYRLDFIYDDEMNPTDIIRHDYICARDVSIVDHIPHLLCYDTLFDNNRVIFKVECNYDDDRRFFWLDEELKLPQRIVSTSKKFIDTLEKTYRERFDIPKPENISDSDNDEIEETEE